MAEGSPAERLRIVPITDPEHSMTVQTLATMRELDSRFSDGIHVRLTYCGRDGRVAVAVLDTRSGESFSVAVRDGERALDVFHHPYAYAAWHGIEPSSSPREIGSAALAA
jgi:hypothetical protein